MPQSSSEKDQFASAVSKNIDYLVNPAIVKKNESIVNDLINSVMSKLNRDSELF